MFCVVLWPRKHSRFLQKPYIPGMAIGRKLPFLRSGSAHLSVHSDGHV